MLSSGLKPCENDNDDITICGFSIKDVRQEIRRASKLVSVANHILILLLFNQLEIFFLFRFVHFVKSTALALAAGLEAVENRIIYRVQ